MHTEVQLRPAIEELRTEFYREIKKFIAIPPSFKGLGYFEEAKGGADKDGKVCGSLGGVETEEQRAAAAPLEP